MEKAELIDKLSDIYNNYTDVGEDHVKADQLLLEFINDDEISKVFNSIDKYYE